jgi:hypothetical protein
MDLEIREIKYRKWTIPAGLKKRHEETKCPFPLPYKAQTGITFTIGRKAGSMYKGYNVVIFCNMIRRFINARVKYNILTFNLNHENTDIAMSVQEIGKTCLPQEIRTSLNGVICRQIKNNEYELHAVNTGPTEIDITTSHIHKKGNKSPHDDFAPNIKLGTLWPGAELHIPLIYMKEGRGFTDELHYSINRKLITPSDNSNFMHNGLTGFRQPEIIDQKTDELKVDPLMLAPSYVELTIPLQPYINPADIIRNAFDQLGQDLEFINSHVINASSQLGSKSIEYKSERVTIHVTDDDLTLTSDGYDESLFTTIAANAKMLDPDRITHYTTQRVLINTKFITLRISAPNVLGLLIKSINVTIDQISEIRTKIETI